MLHEVIIIGAGPAGLAAAIQLRRYGVEPLLLEREITGGLLHNANLVENYPGFPHGITGPDLARLMVKQAEQAGVQVTFEAVTSLSFIEPLFQAITPQNTYQAQRVVIATGTQPRRITDFTIPFQLQDRVLYEVYPLLRAHERQIAIIGAGDAAFDYAINLGKHNRVTILNRSAQPRCLPLLWDRAHIVDTITYRQEIAVEKLIRAPGGGMLVECRGPDGVERLSVDFLVVAIGREARLDFLSGIMRDNIAALVQQARLYLIGDVTNGIYRQTAIAVGQGVQAAMQIYHVMENERA
jgi:thioredoxin reductase